jgi:hypothetical protein
MNLTSKTIWLRTFYPLALFIGILTYLITKALVMQTTCDEAYTVLILSKQPTWDLITYKDSYTNNHILNTLITKGLFAVFGMNHSLARVPGLVGFLMYFYCSFRFSQKYIIDDALSVMFLTVMCCNPYLLDFFALARGYGLSIGLMMVSVYLAANVVFQKKSAAYDLPLSILAAILSVYAQFASLHFYLGVNLLFFLYALNQWITHNDKKEFIKTFVTQIVGFGVLSLLVYLPFKAIIRDNQIAYYGADGFWENTISSVISNSIYAQGYFTDATTPIFKRLLLFVFFIVVAKIAYNLGQKKNQESEKIYPSVFAALLFSCTATSVILQFHLLKNQYVVDRTALFFYPLMALSFPTIALFFGYFKKWAGGFVMAIFILFSLNHLKRGADLSYYREWWYDVNTYEILDFLKTEHDKTDKKETLKLGTTWIFNPSFMYHREKSKLTWIEPLRYSKQPDTTNFYHFYYATNDEIPVLSSKYEKIKEYGYGQWILMKRRNYDK